MRIREDIQNSYSLLHCERMNAFREGLWAHPEWIVELPPNTIRGVISYLLGIACQAAHIGPIMIGRRALCAMPRAWLVERIEAVADETIGLHDEWDYRRLVELYCCLDDGLSQRLASHGLADPNPEIREAAQDYLKNPEDFKKMVCKDLDKPLP